MKLICVGLLTLVIAACSSGGSSTHQNSPAPAPPQQNPRPDPNKATPDVGPEHCKGAAENSMLGTWVTRFSTNNSTQDWNLTFNDTFGVTLTNDCYFADQSFLSAQISAIYSNPTYDAFEIDQGGETVNKDHDDQCWAALLPHIVYKHRFEGSCMVINDGAGDIYLVRHL